MYTGPGGGLYTGPGGGLYTGPDDVYHSNQPPRDDLLRYLEQMGMRDIIEYLLRHGF
jgi:hypothetical protein